MARAARNTQMFALRRPPPDELELAGGVYRLVRVFKHDFWAATCLYEAAGPAEISRIVAKFGRAQPFCGLPMAPIGRMLRAHERDIYRALSGLEGVPRWVGSFGETGYAVEYIDALPLDHHDEPPAGFFDRLAELFDEIHARGVAYADGNKRSNILVGPGGRPFLIDFQISFRTRDDWPRPVRALVAAAVRYVQRGDLYHLYKHKRRLRPGELTESQRELSRRRGLLHTMHRKLTDPYRRARRWFLRRQHRAGRLESPTADLEDHHQPEKATWREGEGGAA